MKSSQTSKLFLRCPIIYRGHREDPQRNLMYFGFECRDGWHHIIYDLSVAIEAIAQDKKQNGVPEHQLPIVNQVKQQFGGLRFYISNCNGEVHDLISDAEDKAAKTCETCGEPRSLLDHEGWLHTLCDQCST